MYVWWKVSDPIPKIETKEMGKLIRNIPKRNTGKLIKIGGSKKDMKKIPQMMIRSKK